MSETHVMLDLAFVSARLSERLGYQVFVTVGETPTIHEGTKGPLYPIYLTVEEDPPRRLRTWWNPAVEVGLQDWYEKYPLSQSVAPTASQELDLIYVETIFHELDLNRGVPQ